MQINYILNRIQKHNGFVYGQARLRKKRTQMILEIEIRPRQNSHPICSGCEKKGPGYDTLPVRWFQFVPLWGMAAFFPLRPPAGRLPSLRCQGRAGSLGARKEPYDHHLGLVPGSLG